MAIPTTLSPPRSHALTTLALLVGFALPIAAERIEAARHA